ncbi:hypothetical protein BEL04_11950 [Mucilaginibacter sp. PPCGB 2223]|uniref:hypothetical protein n=1 Tax=Mucilaginibacter sp. PPCGB 2223 TaxID=1886027 RepID=UPI000825E402|nr:hypothetical protein [Mucilaginibacter sp. PPCGB 2223]OCX52194.1 hypothetical protein BEL04_11950 [Mucilaginibacter sp. PPCGB 2223]
MKTKMYLLATALLFLFAINTSKAATPITTYTPYTKEYIATMTAEERQARIEEIKDRVNEIRAMDKSSLTRAEKKELKVELKEMRHEANAISAAGGGGGIYLSVGAIIIIILLLILIL